MELAVVSTLFSLYASGRLSPTEHDTHPILLHTEVIPIKSEASEAFKSRAVEVIGAAEYDLAVGLEVGAGIPITFPTSSAITTGEDMTLMTVNGNPAFRSKEAAIDYIEESLAGDVSHLADRTDFIAEKRVGVLQTSGEGLIRKVIDDDEPVDDLLTG